MREGKNPVQNTRSGIRIVAWTAFGLLLGACSPTDRVHGYVPDDIDLDAVLPGVDTVASLEASIGPPSASGIVQSNAWYYVQSTVRHYTYNRPEVTDREVLAIQFDDDGVVKDLTRYGLEDGRVVDLKREITVTHGQTLTALQQLFGNFGSLSPNQIFSGDERTN